MEPNPKINGSTSTSTSNSLNNSEIEIDLNSDGHLSEIALEYQQNTDFEGHHFLSSVPQISPIQILFQPRPLTNQPSVQLTCPYPDPHLHSILQSPVTQTHIQIAFTNTIEDSQEEIARCSDFEIPIKRAQSQTLPINPATSTSTSDFPYSNDACVNTDQSHDHDFGHGSNINKLSLSAKNKMESEIETHYHHQKYPTTSSKSNANDSKNSDHTDVIKCELQEGKLLPADTLPKIPSSIYVYRTEDKNRPTDRRVTMGYKHDLYKGQEKGKLRPRLLIVESGDEKDEHVDFHMRALDKRFSRDNLEALNILKTIQQSASSASAISEFDNRERYYRRKHIIAWKAALAMPRTKKIPFETVIPLAATQFMRKSLPTLERIRRRFIKCFGFRVGRRRFVDEVLTERSVDDFNYLDKDLKEVELSQGLGGHIGGQRRIRLFASSVPQMPDFD